MASPDDSMDTLDTRFMDRCIAALERALQMLGDSQAESIEYDLYRSACVKEFEIILEQAGKLLRRALKPYFHSSREADRLVFKDIFRHAARHGLITLDAGERWLQYRDNRTNAAHDYGIGFAEETLKLLPQFIEDARAITASIQRSNAQ